MCIGNRAEVSAHYINSQLRALWENAEACVKKHDNGLKPTRSEMEYGFAFSQFYYGKHNRYNASKDDLSFYASFGCPRLEFVCNHEAVLYLTPKEGHFYVENNKSVHRADTEHKHSFSGYEVAFRIEFATHTIRNVSCGAIGNKSTYNVDLLILDFATATFCDYLSELPDLITEKGPDFRSREVTALTHYLGYHYLSLLKRAGFHVLYSLPDFDNLSRTQSLDYSIIANRSLTTTNIFGISVTEVNTFLRGLWLQAAAHIDEHGTGDDHASFTSFYLAEHRNVWNEDGEDVHFHAYFGPLQVQPLCKREVVLYLSIQDVTFYLGGFKSDKKYDFSDWKIAVIVDVEAEESEQGAVRKLKLNLSTARFCEHLSVFTAEFEDRQLFIRLRSALVRYMTTRYLSILEETEHCYIYHKDTRIIHNHDDESETESGEEDEEIGCWCEDEADCGHAYVHGHIYWGQVIRKMVTHAHDLEDDFVTSITQGALNKQWKLLWELAAQKAESLGVHEERSLQTVLSLCLADYIFERDGHVLFTASFGAPQIRLVCEPGSTKVIMYFNLKEGYLKALGFDKSYDASGPEHHFSRWMVAFEVELKMRDCSKQTKVPEYIRKRLGNVDDANFKQLVLDFSTAKFLDSQSTIPGLVDGNDFRLIRKRREALLHYFARHYFPTLTVAGLDVLYTLPVYAEKKNDALSLTSVSFQVCPFTFGPHHHYVEGIRGRQRAVFDRNMIVFIGMTEGRPFPREELPHTGLWCSGFSRELSYGTVILSRRVFLEGKFLSLLSQINKETTVLPSFSGVEDGKWNLSLTTWNNHEAKKNRECHFREVAQKADGRLEFVWSNRDKWSYEHEGDVENTGSYRVSCDTLNKLILPTGDNNGNCSIKLTGSVVLKLVYEGSKQHWRSEASANWSSTITLSSSDGSGVRVRVTSDTITPDCSELHSEGHLEHSTFVNAAAELKAQLPSVLNISHIVSELKASLEGAWPLLFSGSGALRVSNPTFNRRGDILLELQPYDVPRDLPSVSEKREKEKNGKLATNEGWFKKISTAVGEVVSTPVSALSPPPTYSPLGVTKTKAAATGSYFHVSSSEVSSPLVPVGNGNGNGNGVEHDDGVDE